MTASKEYLESLQRERGYAQAAIDAGTRTKPLDDLDAEIDRVQEELDREATEEAAVDPDDRKDQAREADAPETADDTSPRETATPDKPKRRSPRQ